MRIVGRPGAGSNRYTAPPVTAHLTDELRDALAAAGGAPLEVEDARTHRKYVILPAAAYRTLNADAGRGGVEEGLASPAGCAVAAAALADVWDDPGLDEYADVPAADDAGTDERAAA